MKRLMALAMVLGACLSVSADWRGLTDANWYSGPKVTENDLLGKVVLVDEWGINCPPCRALLPRMEEVWKSFKSRPFLLIGSHRQGRAPEEVAKLVKANRLTYPQYEGAGLAVGEPSNGGGIPFMYVLNHRGKVVYSGRSHQEAVEAVVNALGEVSGSYVLTSGVTLRKYKTLEKQLVFGKSVKSIVDKLQSDIKRGQLKLASEAARQQAEEAEAILKSIDAAKEDIKADIEIAKKKNPVDALSLMKKFTTTFPGDPAAAEYKSGFAEWSVKAKQWSAEQKAKAKAKAK